MKKTLLLSLLTGSILIFTACKKSSTTPTPANPLAAINASWINTAWGGAPNNPIVITIDQNTAAGVIKSIGSQTYNFSVGETILSNIAASANTAVFNCNAIFKYGNGNQTVANTTATITLVNSAQILIHYQPAAGIQPPDYNYTKQ